MPTSRSISADATRTAAADPKRLIWVDGRLADIGEKVVRADDGAFAEGRGCYTSVAIVAGRPRFPERHIARLQRGARALRLGEVDVGVVEKALAELAAAALPSGEGIVRIQLSRCPGGPMQVTGVPRGLGPDRACWSAISSTIRHSGAVLTGGHKLTNRLVLGLAADQARAAGVDDALLFDHADHLVETSRCNLVVVADDGAPAAPDDALGAVTGIGLEVVLEQTPEIARREIERGELPNAREIIALNSVRGARPIVRLDGKAVGDGEPGPWAARLHDAFLRG